MFFKTDNRSSLIVVLTNSQFCCCHYAVFTLDVRYHQSNGPEAASDCWIQAKSDTALCYKFLLTY